MGIGLKARLQRTYQKNADELIALATGRMPRFVVSGRAAGPPGEPPVFCFHDVDPRRFEAQLLHLRDNRYRTLDAAELGARLSAGADAPGGSAAREVALTFDDATWTFWTYAFPLLRRYGARAILFAIPGLVPDDPEPHPNLDDVDAGRAGAPELADRGARQSLCTWRELEIMHESGLVDVQSHSVTHSRVPISARVVDFFHPGYPLEAYGNVNLPLPALDDPRRPRRSLAMGAPILESASRMAGSPRFVESPEAVATVAGIVSAGGGERFFERPGWRAELARACRGLPGGLGGRYETRDEMEASLLWELRQSKALLEERLPSKRVSHFCYPWFQGSRTSDALAARAGYAAVHYGLALPAGGVESGGAAEAAAPGPLRVRRLSEEYLERLPGAGRVSLASIWSRRVAASLGRGRALP